MTTEFGPDLLAGFDAPDRARIRADSLPASTWGSNLRGILAPKDWDRLRIATAEAADNRCEVCHARSAGRRPAAHEQWIFAPVEGLPVQRLGRLVALCIGCHRVAHIGLAGLRGEMPLVKRHLARVNRWSMIDVVADLHRAAERALLLERFEWDLDLRVLAGRVTVPGYPDLYIPAGGRAYLGNAFRRTARARPTDG
jgi:hypothetical protein